ncbi:MAG: hypothetical protein IPK12_01655 [Gemmatimonadetes bacterium]|nr:hypothetical protein [Gemmatimonadota bacterium]
MPAPVRTFTPWRSTRERHLHLLTELQTLWALGAQPFQWFEDSSTVQGANEALAQLTPATLAAARRQVVLLLAEQYGIAAPDVDWMTAEVAPSRGPGV